MLLKSPPRWSLPESEAAPEAVFQNRRELIRRLAASGIAGALLPSAGAAAANAKPKRPVRSRAPGAELYPASRNARYAVEGPLTPEKIASRHNVFDEFSLERNLVWQSVSRFTTNPWRIHVGGAVEKQLEFDADELVSKMGIEERLYRFRCVETWAMAVPWTGFPFRRFLELVKPLAAAKFVRMVSIARPDEMPNWYGSRRVFPYYEALSLEEANNDLAFLAMGIYGHSLPPQHGAPLRLVVPWKYGLKGIKSIVAFQLTRERPGTFWNELAPHHYSFLSNVDPAEEGQAEETVLDTGEKRKTTPYNGYAAEVAGLYA
jgi:methionine sulfoxide reductase catalytic subunit